VEVLKHFPPVLRRAGVSTMDFKSLVCFRSGVRGLGVENAGRRLSVGMERKPDAARDGHSKIERVFQSGLIAVGFGKCPVVARALQTRRCPLHQPIERGIQPLGRSGFLGQAQNPATLLDEFHVCRCHFWLWRLVWNLRPFTHDGNLPRARPEVENG
jgi:hypothetical protein